MNKIDKKEINLNSEFFMEPEYKIEEFSIEVDEFFMEPEFNPEFKIEEFLKEVDEFLLNLDLISMDYCRN